LNHFIVPRAIVDLLNDNCGIIGGLAANAATQLCTFFGFGAPAVVPSGGADQITKPDDRPIGAPLLVGARAGRSACGRLKLPFKARPEMREELPMNYIDLLKRVAVPLGTIMALSSALAQEQLTKADLIQLAVTLGVYDNRCENLAPRLLADVQLMVRMLDKGDVMAAVINEQDKVDRVGEAKWCVALRPVVEKYKDGLFEPVR
jgi:hypothetical protein